MILIFLLACASEEVSKDVSKEVSKDVSKEVSKEGNKEKHGAAHNHAHKKTHHEKDKSATVLEPGKIPEGAKVFFLSPKDGGEVSSPLKVQMGVEGMKVQPAGEIVEGTGHHHIIIDTDPVKKGTVVGSDAQHLHFGKGQTETELTLSPGKHTLQLQFARRPTDACVVAFVA